MAEYIKREDAFRVIEQSPIAHLGTRFFCMDGIEAIPAADVVPRELYQRALSDVVTLSVERKRGKWIMSITEPVVGRICSNCGFAWCTQIDAVKLQPVFSNIKTAYCPNCGAKMESADDV